MTALINIPVEDMTDAEFNEFCDEAIKAQIEADRAIKAFSLKKMFEKYDHHSENYHED